MAARAGAALLLVASAPLAVSVRPAGADPNCPHGANWISTACFYGATQVGTYAEWHNNFMSVDQRLKTVNEAHINQSVWAHSGSPCSAFVEIGLTQGFHNRPEYRWYTARRTTWGFYSDDALPATVWDGSNHSYWINYDGVSNNNGQYTLLKDGWPVMTYNGLGFGSCISQQGLEMSKVSYTAGGVPDAAYHADTFDVTPLYWQDVFRNWHWGFNTSMAWVDFGCGPGRQPPFCLNGTYYGPGQWSNNKP